MDAIAYVVTVVTGTAIWWGLQKLRSREFWDRYYDRQYRKAWADLFTRITRFGRE